MLRPLIVSCCFVGFQATASGPLGAQLTPSFNIPVEIQVSAESGPFSKTAFATDIKATPTRIDEPLVIGSQQWKSDPIIIDRLREAMFDCGSVIVVGDAADARDSGVRQLVDRTSGRVSEREFFQGYANEPASHGWVAGVSKLDDGRIVYHGCTSDGSPAIWFQPGTPVRLPVPGGIGRRYGDVLNIAGDGRLAGHFWWECDGNGTHGGLAAAGRIDGDFHEIPSYTGSFAQYISSDGDFLTGYGFTPLWKSTAVGIDDYESVSIADWEIPIDALELPCLLGDVFKTSQRHVVAAGYITPDFENCFAVYDLRTGEIIGVTEAGDSLTGSLVYRDHLVIAVYGLNGGAFYVVGDDGLGPRVELSELIDYPWSGGMIGYNGLITTMFDDGGLGFTATTLHSSGSRLETCAYSISLEGGRTEGLKTHFQVAVDHPEYFEQVPLISADGTLSFTPSATAGGLARIRVRLVDDGHPGKVSEWKAFRIRIDRVPTSLESAVHHGRYPENVVSWLAGGNMEVGVRGSAHFDPARLNRRTIFIGDERNDAGAPVVSLSIRDTDGDGFNDVLFRVSTDSALREDTDRLIVTFRTQDTTRFNASRPVISTDLLWWEYWFEEFGRLWRAEFLGYDSNDRATWW